MIDAVGAKGLIASGLQPEKGPLQFYNWDQYINPQVVKAFEKKYNVKVQISTFTTIDASHTPRNEGDENCRQQPDAQLLNKSV